MQNFPVNTLLIKIWYNWLGENPIPWLGEILALPILMTGCIIIHVHVCTYTFSFHSVVPISVMENSLLMTMKSILMTACFAV